MAFDESCFARTGVAADHALLCSIGPLDHVDRLAPGQELKFALDGLTIIFGENGSGKSGYARAARRLCTSRVPLKLQGNVFKENEIAPTVGFTVKIGDADPVPHQWVEGSPLPDACAHIAFLDTANARTYVEDKTEILYLPPEVSCLTTLGQLYGLAAQQCQTASDALTTVHSGAVGGQFSLTTTAGSLVSKLTIAAALVDLPSTEALRAAAVWDHKAAAQLADVRLQLAQGPAGQARTLRRLGDAAKLIADKSIAAIPSLGQAEIDQDAVLVRKRAEARFAAEAFVAEQAGQYPIAATGSETWRQLFLLARQFAAEAGLVSKDGAFETGDPCMLCQRPLDAEARDRFAAFDAYIEAEATAAVGAANDAVAIRVAALRALNLVTADQVLQTLPSIAPVTRRCAKSSNARRRRSGR
jgi:hypothetical protein